MTQTIVLYALKQASGYVKLEKDTFQLVDMQKASVFSDLNQLKTAAHRLPDLASASIVELSITERHVGHVK